MLTIIRSGSLIAATVTMGLMAGVFGLYSHTIMRGLRQTDDRTFVAAFAQIDRAIVNPWFMVSFLGALAFTALAAIMLLGKDVRSVLPWVGIALVLYLLAVIITVAIHLPLNDSLKAAGDPDHILDVATVREQFNEARWVSWNLVRTLTSTAAFLCLTWALVLYGRTAPSS